MFTSTVDPAAGEFAVAEIVVPREQKILVRAMSSSEVTRVLVGGGTVIATGSTGAFVSMWNPPGVGSIALAGSRADASILGWVILDPDVTLIGWDMVIDGATGQRLSLVSQVADAITTFNVYGKIFGLEPNTNLGMST
jgi:hypothetical protein